MAWRRQELFYTTLQDPARMMAVDIAARNGAIQAGIPRPLFDVWMPMAALRNRFLATRDGKKFLAIVAPPEPKGRQQLHGDCELAVAAEEVEAARRQRRCLACSGEKP